MECKRISSLDNPLIKQVVRLHEAKERKLTQLCLVEGVRTIETALTGLMLQTIYCTDAQIEEARRLTDERSIICVTDSVMRKISTATTPSGMLAVCKIPPQPPFSTLSRGLVCAQISDPGNMGTLIRTAAACGISSVVIVEGVDPWSPKVTRASAGTIAQVSVFQCDWSTLIAEKRKLKLYALVVEGGNQIEKVENDNALLVVGNEARGIPDEWLKSCDEQITLTMPGGTESLNAAIAGSIALYLTFVKKGS